WPSKERVMMEWKDRFARVCAALLAVLAATCLAQSARCAEAPDADEAAEAAFQKERYKGIVLDGELDFSEIGLLAVQQGGRKKPLHTLAVESVEQLTGRRFFLATPYWQDPATKTP